jgi:hypothetical protein
MNVPSDGSVGSVKKTAGVADGRVGLAIMGVENNGGAAVEADARELARECLVEIGKEMGVGC